MGTFSQSNTAESRSPSGAEAISPGAKERDVRLTLEFDLVDIRLDKRDRLAMFYLALWTLSLNFLGTLRLEFFRHTEADRTLIAWEMLERGDFLVPHLLDSVILTKPPLFYWFVAGSIQLFGGLSEWIARFPSVVASTCVVLSQFWFVRRAGGTLGAAFLCAFALSTGVLFIDLGRVAEIDMAFGLFCMLSLSFGYLLIVSNSLFYAVLAYAAAALSFLIKGPPGLFFLGGSQLVFFLLYRQMAAPAERNSIITWKRFILLNLCGVAIFSMITLLWLAALASRVGWEEIIHSFQVEVLDRVFEPARQKRGVFFYIPNALVAALPWSVFLVLGGILLPMLPKERPRLRGLLYLREYRNFAAYSLCVVLVAIGLLSIAEGKSTRYLFPVYSFLICLSVCGLYQLQGSIVLKRLYGLGKCISIGGLAALLLLPFFLTLSGVSFLDVAIAALAFALPLTLLGIACSKRYGAEAILAIGILIFALRISEFFVYAPHRNVTKSVQQEAGAIDQLIPARAPIYTVEMFERWVVYYLVRGGRTVQRLTPAKVEAMSKDSLPLYLLLNEDEESWRVPMLRKADPNLRMLGEFGQAPDRLLLLEVAPKALTQLKPHRVFPTVPSPPHYMEESGYQDS